MEVVGFVPKAREQERVRHPVVINTPGDLLLVKLVIYGVLVVKVFVFYVHTSRHFHVPLRRTGMHKKAGCPRGGIQLASIPGSSGQ